MLRIRDFLDRWLTRLRWPIAIGMALLLPGIVWALLSLCWEILGDPWPIRYFAAGSLLWLAIWFFALRNSRFSFLLTLEHETTHAIFAWLTFHKVTGIRATLTRGGQMSFEGSGNFLITLAPYFFPTPAIGLLLLLAISPMPYQLVPEFLIGFAFAWHLTSTLRETHPGQTDIQKAGMLFSLLFLPPAIGFFVGVVLSASHGGLFGMSGFAADCVALAIHVYKLPFA